MNTRSTTSTSRLCYALLSAGLLSLGTAAQADDNGFRSSTRLSAAQEIADVPVQSGGRARAIIRFNPDFSSAEVRVRFNGLAGEFTRLHLHCHIAGANGPVAIGLVDFVAATFDNQPDVTLEGQRVVGTLTNANFPRPFASDGEPDPCIDTIGRPINNLASLAAAINEGSVYWNLHTTAFPPGELRGQVRPLRRDD